MRRRWKLILGGLVVLAVIGACLAVLRGWEPITRVASWFEGTRPTVRLGLLHSQTGTLAISEKSLLDAEVLAIEEVNAAGGVSGRQIVWSAPDCRSDPEVFASEARRLIDQEKVAALFGAWTSECRKAILPVLDERSSLLFFPGNFEGIEKSPRVVYVGGIANQSVLPAVRWAFDSLKARRYFVVGLEEVWSRCSAEIAKDGVKAAGAETVGENFQVGSSFNPDSAIEAIRQAKPDVVLNFVYGGANLEFYSAIRRAGLTPEKVPIIAFGFSEDESRRFVPSDVAGQYAAWNYFQSSTRPESREFVRKFRARFGEDRLVGDAMVAAYNGIKFWAQAAREVGVSDVSAVITNLTQQSMDAPDGIVTIDADSRAVWRPFHLGRLRADGQFEIVWSILKPIRPVPFVGTRSAEQWRGLLESLHTRWKGRWSAGASAASTQSRPSPGSNFSEQ